MSRDYHVSFTQNDSVCTIFQLMAKKWQGTPVLVVFPALAAKSIIYLSLFPNLRIRRHLHPCGKWCHTGDVEQMLVGEILRDGVVAPTAATEGVGDR